MAACLIPSWIPDLPGRGQGGFQVTGHSFQGISLEIWVREDLHGEGLILQRAD